VVVEVVPEATGGSTAAADLQRAVELRTGQELAVRLGCFSGTGYAWEMAGPAPAVLTMEAHAAPVSTAQTPGAPTWTEFRMRAVASGDAALRFVLRRPWEPAGQHARSLDVAVVVLPARPANDSR
jgi:predicted secreted protein